MYSLEYDQKCLRQLLWQRKLLTTIWSVVLVIHVTNAYFGKMTTIDYVVSGFSFVTVLWYVFYHLNDRIARYRRYIVVAKLTGPIELGMDYENSREP